MKINKITLIACCIVFSIFLTSCTSTSTVNEEQDTQKFNTYVELQNFMSGWFSLTLQNYFNEFGADEEIHIKENFDGFGSNPIIETHYTYHIDGPLEKASQEPVYDGVDDSIKDLCPKLKELMDTMNEVAEYYNNDSYKTDDFAKGKELHKKVCAQTIDYINSSMNLSIAFEKLNDQKMEESLTEIDKEKYPIRYYSLSILVKSKKIPQAFYAAEIDDTNISNFDAKQYEDLYASLVKDINEFMECTKDNDKISTEGFALESTFAMFVDNVNRVNLSAENLRNKLNGTPIISNSHGQVTTSNTIGFLEDLENSISDLIGSYNSMR